MQVLRLLQRQTIILALMAGAMISSTVAVAAAAGQPAATPITTSTATVVDDDPKSTATTTPAATRPARSATATPTREATIRAAAEAPAQIGVWAYSCYDPNRAGETQIVFGGVSPAGLSATLCAPVPGTIDVTISSPETGDSDSASNVGTGGYEQSLAVAPGPGYTLSDNLSGQTSPAFELASLQIVEISLYQYTDVEPDVPATADVGNAFSMPVWIRSCEDTERADGVDFIVDADFSVASTFCDVAAGYAGTVSLLALDGDVVQTVAFVDGQAIFGYTGENQQGYIPRGYYSVRLDETGDTSETFLVGQTENGQHFGTEVTILRYVAQVVITPTPPQITPDAPTPTVFPTSGVTPNPGLTPTAITSGGDDPTATVPTSTPPPTQTSTPTPTSDAATPIATATADPSDPTTAPGKPTKPVKATSLPNTGQGRQESSDLSTWFLLTASMTAIAGAAFVGLRGRRS
ncbi:MAG TPA: hypothetical protein VFQ54_12330 [Thermomicrobiales bacterium]|nr:hypothetical protein [Thermomicrobiales bacterium]